MGVILSGSGCDGSIGIKAVSEAGGFTLAQGKDPNTASYDEMPAAAVATGFVDVVSPVPQLADKLVAYAQGFARNRLVDNPNIEDIESAKQELYRLLHTRQGHDFSHYKDKTFLRRVERRMHVRQIDDILSYVELVRNEPDEAAFLFRDLLIGVTTFFRDKESFDALSEMVMPRLFQSKAPGDVLRVWVPGCATGEEAYSLAILLREGLDKANKPVRVQIFATDLDDKALAVARAGRYPERVLESVSPDRLARFFVGDGATYTVAKNIRDLCLFSSHSLIRDPPFSQIDLISCRNLLIYFNSELQDEVVPLFHYALRPSGYLFLGISENVSRHTELFTPIDKKNRIFQRREFASRRHALLPLLAHADVRLAPRLRVHAPQSAGDAIVRRMDARILDRYTPAHVLVDHNLDVLHYSSRTGKYLEHPAGAPSRNLLTLVRKGLDLPLRSALHEVKGTGKAAERQGIKYEVDGQALALDLTVEPIKDGEEAYWLVVFSESSTDRIPEPVIGSRTSGDEMVAQLQQELKETRERLETATEEHETSVEELKSANEELLSINEELQSTNEELETSKEELQSVNEELHTVNSELSGKVDELDRANSDLKNLFDSTRIAIIFLDNNLIVRNFTPASAEIVKLIPSDQGRPLSDIATTLDCEWLGSDLHRVIETKQEVERRASRRDGKAHYLMRILPYRTTTNEVEGVSVSFIDVTDMVRAEGHHRLLVDELNHRVKNIMAVIAAFSQQMARRYTSVEEFADAFIGRIQGMAKTHEMLSAKGWTHVGLADLLVAELSIFAIDADRYRLSGPEVRLNPATATTLGIVFHELGTNAVKYGALSNQTGSVGVDWGVEARDGGDWLLLTWREIGGPLAAPPTAKGLGNEIIERSVSYELGGQTRVEYPPEGVVATISFPAAGALAAADERATR